jgi:hypothetical protein
MAQLNAFRADKDPVRPLNERVNLTCRATAEAADCFWSSGIRLFGHYLFLISGQVCLPHFVVLYLIDVDSASYLRVLIHCYALVVQTDSRVKLTDRQILAF